MLANGNNFAFQQVKNIPLIQGKERLHNQTVFYYVY